MKKSFLFSALGIALAIALITVSNLTAQAPADDKPAKQQKVFIIQASGHVREVKGDANKLLTDGWRVAALVGSGSADTNGTAGIIVLVNYPKAISRWRASPSGQSSQRHLDLISGL